MASDLNELIHNLRSSLQETPLFRCPLPQPFPISQRFGENPDWYKRFGFSTGHNGLDLAAPARTPVLASDGGIVIKTGFDQYGYGHYVKIAHDNSYTSLYAHLSEIQVKNAQLVQPGQQIALSGDTGFSTGPHLHFEIRKDNTPIDPEPLLLPVIGGGDLGCHSNPPQEGEKSYAHSPSEATVTVPILNIRSAPSITAPVIGQLKQGQKITILEHITTIWVQIAENAYIAHTFENDQYLDEVPDGLVRGEVPAVIASEAKQSIRGEVPAVIASAASEASKAKQSIRGEVPAVIASAAKQSIRNELPNVIASKAKQSIRGEVPAVIASEAKQSIQDELPNVIASAASEAKQSIRNELPTVIASEAKQSIRNELPNVIASEAKQSIRNELPAVIASAASEAKQSIRNELPNVIASEASAAKQSIQDELQP